MEDAPSNLAIVGRYVLDNSVFDYLAEERSGAGGEIQLTDGIASLMTDESIFSYKFEGRRFDCGAKLGHLQANAWFGLKHPDIGPAFRHYLDAEVL